MGWVRDDDFEGMSEARRHLGDHDDAASERDEASADEDKSSRRSEGLDTLKCYLREVRRSSSSPSSRSSSLVNG